MEPVSGGSYDRFLARLRKLALISEVQTLLGWDEQVYLPAGAVEGRADQSAEMARLIHEETVHPEFVGLVGELLEDDTLTEDARINVAAVWEDIEEELKVPADLAAAMASAASQGYAAWQEARERNSFSVALPSFERVFALNREYAECVRGERSVFDAILQVHQPRLTEAETSRYFAQIGPVLTRLAAGHSARSWGKQVPPFPITVPVGKQHKIALAIAERMGFDFRRGRVDIAAHPASYNPGFDDIRITTRYREDDIIDGIYSLIHEVGHALYDLGCLPEHARTPLGSASSIGIHESQSRLWENIVGRSRSFARFLTGFLRKHTRQAYELDEFIVYEHLTRVRPNLIRIDADEVTYGLHIIVRFELERALFAGQLDIRNLPEAWNERYQHYLGILPPDEFHGVLQDPHWYEGLFGYFPAYLLGNMYSAQIYAAAAKGLPTLDRDIERGRFTGLKEWLNQNIHRHGRRFQPNELIRKATGELPNPDYYLRYLEGKYSA